jgi:multidrug transporter EmrE-like cation transporter
MNERTIALLLLGTCVVFGALAQVFFKIGMSRIPGKTFTELIVVAIRDQYVLGGILLYSVSFILWLLAIKYLELSFMYPMLSLAYVIVVFLSATFLKEEVHLSRWVGVVLIIIGAILVGLNK